VALVHVDDRGLDPERLEHLHASDAEERVLLEPHRAVADVETGRDPALVDPVVLSVRVEQVQGNPSDLRPPHLHAHGATTDLQLDDERAAVLVGHEGGGEVVGLDLDPVVVLPSRRVQALVEVPLRVQDPDADHRQPEIGGALEHVAGEYPESALADRERTVDAELRADERDGMLGRDHSPG
jgi:hypothetical protein